jgi:hypothetical protein
MCCDSYLANQNLSDRGAQPASKNRRTAPDLFFARVVYPRSDLCILPTRDQPAPPALHHEIRQPVVCAGYPGAVGEDETAYGVRRDDGDCRVRCGKSYRHRIGMDLGVLENVFKHPRSPPRDLCPPCHHIPATLMNSASSVYSADTDSASCLLKASSNEAMTLRTASSSFAL